MTGIMILFKVALAVMLLALILLIAGLASNRPPLLDPPGLFPRLKASLGSNIAHTGRNSPYPELEQRCYSAPADELLTQVRAAAEQLGYVIEAQSQERGLHLVITTPLWRFRDDMHIRIIEENAGRSCLEIHSQSRVGRGDLGANARHIVRLHTMLDQLLESTPGK